MSELLVLLVYWLCHFSVKSKIDQKELVRQNPPPCEFKGSERPLHLRKLWVKGSQAKMKLT